MLVAMEPVLPPLIIQEGKIFLSASSGAATKRVYEKLIENINIAKRKVVSNQDTLQSEMRSIEKSIGNCKIRKGKSR